jgi:RES domain-containing protein
MSRAMNNAATVLWRIATQTSAYAATDLSGTGARLTGGRWNSPGRPVVYTSASMSLAVLETVVHLKSSTFPFARYLVRLEVPHALWKARRICGPDDAPAGWDALPAGNVSRHHGDAWLAAGQPALLEVPSVVLPEESNVLINPLHRDAHKVKATMVRPFAYDGRLISVK